MQRDSRELANIFDRTVPGQAVVHFGNHAKVYAVGSSLYQHILDDPAFAWSSEENLIHKMLARVLKERIERANYVAGCCPGG